MLNERQRANLDILESNEAPRPASPTRQDVSEADVTPAKIAPVSRISAAVRAEDRRKAEKVRASAVFSALGDGAWASQTQEVAMAVEEEVAVKAEEAPVQFKGSVRFEIKQARAAPTRPACGWTTTRCCWISIRTKDGTICAHTRARPDAL